MWSTMQLCNTFSAIECCSNGKVAYDFVMVSGTLPNVTAQSGQCTKVAAVVAPHAPVAGV